MRRFVLWGATACLLVLGAMVPPSRAGEPRARDVYVRRRTTIPKTVRWLVQEARRQQVGQLLVVFDAATFAPPPGVTEFSMGRLYPDDLPAWIEALGNEVADAPCPIRATSSLAQRTIAVGKGPWRHTLAEMVSEPWWKGDKIQKLEPAARWVNRLLQVTESGIESTPGPKRRMLALIAGTFTPERWLFLGNRPVWETDWRTRLRDVGTYWDEEAIAARLERDGCLFYAIAPESHFCDFRPFVELPEMPWVARPQFPPMRFGSRSRDGPITPPDVFDEDAVRQSLDELLKDEIADPAERRREVERRLRRLRAAWKKARGPRNDGSGRAPTTPGPRAQPPRSPPAPLQSSSWRFRSFTPYWFPRTGTSLLINNHAPSGYGYWPYVRVAAKTGGKYAFYPFPPTRWLDICPYDPSLLDRLSPDLVHRAKYFARLKGDAASDAVARATGLVVDGTPWFDADYQTRTASGWGSFRRTSPIRFHDDWFLRRKPIELVFEFPGDARKSLLRTGTRLQKEVLPLYDKALSILDEAIADELTGVRRSHPRAVADLVLARYWFAMSAFHLEAFSIYAVEIERFVPERITRIDRWWVVYIPTIKMSDTLDGYTGQELTAEDEANYERWVLPDQPGMQGNILLIDPEHTHYRAKRKLTDVMKNMDPRLVPRALDMIHSARRVMKDYGMSGWGWTTYYSIAYTFIFIPLTDSRGLPPDRPGDVEPSGPVTPPDTPRGPDTTPGGSEPGGPTTGG